MARSSAEGAVPINPFFGERENEPRGVEIGEEERNVQGERFLRNELPECDGRRRRLGGDLTLDSGLSKSRDQGDVG